MKRPPEIRVSKRNAFTLVEMLLVVALIVLLISMLLPALGRTKMAAKITLCQSLQKQLGSATFMYSLDYDGRLWPIDHSVDHYWHDKLIPYYGDGDQVRICPEAEIIKGSPGFGHAKRAWHWAMNESYGSYGLNLWFTPKGVYQNDPVFQQEGYYRNFKSADPKAPVYTDASWVGAWPEATDFVPADLFYGHGAHAEGFLMGRFAIDRHDGGTNHVKIDLSVAWSSIAGLWKLQWHRGFVPTDVTVP